MGFVFIFIGCIFLINPSFGLVDVLPDAIGIPIILYGISKAADINTHLSVSRTRMRAGLCVAVAETVFAVAQITRLIDENITVSILLVTSVLECVFLIPAFFRLFDGFDFLCPDDSTAKNGNIRTVTAAFIVVRAATSLVPYVVGMLAETSGGDVSSPRGLSPAQITAFLQGAMMVATFVFGVIWLVMIGKTVMPLHKNGELNERLFDKYRTEILSNKEIMLERNVKRFLVFFVASLIPMITVKLDNTFFIPEMLFSVLILTGMALSGGFGKSKKLKVLLVIFAVVSTAGYVMLFRYTTMFSDLFEPFSEEGFLPAFLLYIIPAAISYVLFAVCAHMICGILRKMTEESVGLRGDAVDERRVNIDVERKKKIIRRVGMMEIIMYIYAAVSIAAMTATPFSRAAWLARIAGGALMTLFAVYISNEIAKEAADAV